jgi:uncharacterized protein YsxB (DUF464 family)
LIRIIFRNIEYTSSGIAFTGNRIAELTIQGHAEQISKKGKFFRTRTGSKYDLVCASISVLSLNLLRSIIIMTGIKPEFQEQKGLLSFKIDSQKATGDQQKLIKILMESFTIGVFDIQKNYKNNIEIEFI